MPQKPQVRAKEKRRLTKRLAAWRAKQDGAPAASSGEKKAAPKAAPKAAAKKAAPKATAKKAAPAAK